MSINDVNLRADLLPTAGISDTVPALVLSSSLGATNHLDPSTGRLVFKVPRLGNFSFLRHAIKKKQKSKYITQHNCVLFVNFYLL